MEPDQPIRDDPRAKRLRSLFAKVLSGDQKLTGQHSKLFIEAICSHSDPVRSAERLLSSTHGLDALKSALFSDESPMFLNTQATNFLCCIQSPELKIIYAGSFLRSLVVAIVDPPIFWNALLRAQRTAKLTDRAVQCFAWLLLQLVSLPQDIASDYFSVAQDTSIQKSLLDSSQLEIRTLGQRIKHVMETVTNQSRVVEEFGPGGRHDNDSHDIKEISILPTPDELACSEPPFLRPAIAIEECSESNRLAVHLDNQFRLLREDMLRDLREELQIALGSKKGRRKGLLIGGLNLKGIKCDESHPWALKLECSRDLPRMPKKERKDRIQFIRDNRDLLRHQSVSCIVADDQLLALVSIDRDEEMLAQSPPVICARFAESKSLRRALVSLKKAEELRLVQLNTAIFAYEPVLQQLQNIKWLALTKEIMQNTIATASSLVSESLIDIIRRVEMQDYIELQDCLRYVVSQCFFPVAALLQLMDSLSRERSPLRTGLYLILSSGRNAPPKGSILAY